MNSVLLIIIFYLLGWKCNNSNAAIGGFHMKNFVLFYGVANVTEEEMNTLVDLIASPVIANTSADPNAAMFHSKTIILEYSIVNYLQPDNLTYIPVKKNHTIGYFHDLLRKYNSTNKDTKLSLKKLQKTLEICPPFSGVSVLTNMEPDDNYLLPEILQLIKNRSLEVIISPFNSTELKSNYIGYRYFNPKDQLSQEYREINEIKYDLDKQSHLRRILNEFVTVNAKTDLFDTSIVMIFDWFSLVQLSIQSSLQEAVNLLVKDLSKTAQIYSYQGHNVRINKILVTSSNIESEFPVEEIDLSKGDDYEYFDNVVANISGSDNDTSRFSMKSLVKGLKFSSPNGLVFLFVGTQPQHTELMPEVLKLMNDKKITVEIAYLRNKHYKKPDIEYQQINEASYKNRPVLT